MDPKKVVIDEPDKSRMSPALAAFCGCLGKLPADYDWKKEYEDALYENYLEKRKRNFY